MIRKGDRIEILPEFQDSGDDSFIWTAVSDEEKGRVDVSPALGLPINPVQCVRVEWIRAANPKG